MDQQRKKHTDFAALIDRSERARATLAEARLEIKNKFDIAGRVRDTVTSEPAKIVVGSLAAFVVLKKLLFRKKPPAPRSREISHLKTERGLLLGLLALLGALAKPAAKMYATKLLKDYLKYRFQPVAASRPGTQRIPRH